MCNIFHHSSCGALAKVDCEPAQHRVRLFQSDNSICAPCVCVSCVRERAHTHARGAHLYSHGNKICPHSPRLLWPVSGYQLECRKADVWEWLINLTFQMRAGQCGTLSSHNWLQNLHLHRICPWIKAALRRKVVFNQSLERWWNSSCVIQRALTVALEWNWLNGFSKLLVREW